MEWVETTGRTVEDAKEAALDQLGVDEHDAEFEILEEPRTGLFGRLRGEARVRARVRPTSVRPKAERRDRRKRRPEGGARRGGRGQGGRKPAAASDAGDDAAGSSEDRSAETAAAQGSTGAVAGQASGSKRRSRGGRGRGGGGQSRPRTDVENRTEQEDGMTEDVTVEEQATIVRSFLDGLVDAFDLDGTLAEERIDDDTIEVRVEGDDLGLLIGPKGQTLQAVQELARTVVQRQASGTHHGRVRIDVAGYRQRRRDALERFARQVAADVASSGVAKALEPMHPADRKVVHDVVNEIDGVSTTSEGEEPRRRVVISPAASADS